MWMYYVGKFIHGGIIVHQDRNFRNEVGGIFTYNMTPEYLPVAESFLTGLGSQHFADSLSAIRSQSHTRGPVQ